VETIRPAAPLTHPKVSFGRAANLTKDLPSIIQAGSTHAFSFGSMPLIKSNSQCFHFICTRYLLTPRLRYATCTIIGRFSVKGGGSLNLLFPVPQQSDLWKPFSG